MNYRKSTLSVLEKVNAVINDLVVINNNNQYNMDIKITNSNGRELLGDNFSANVEIQFTEESRNYDKATQMIMDIKGIKEKVPTFKIVKDKRVELLKLFETHRCGKCALNYYEKGSHIEFMVSIDGYDQFDNIEVTCPGINDQVLTIGNKYHIFDLREYNVNGSIAYETLIDIKKVENSTEYEFYFENIETPFTTYTRGNVNDSQKIIHRFDYIVFDKFKANYIKDSLSLITRNLDILETEDGIKNNKPYYELISKLMEKRVEFGI